VYAALVTATGFKPGVASAKAPGGFDSHPLPLRKQESSDFPRILALSKTDLTHLNAFWRYLAPRLAPISDGMSLIGAPFPAAGLSGASEGSPFTFPAALAKSSSVTMRYRRRPFPSCPSTRKPCDRATRFRVPFDGSPAGCGRFAAMPKRRAGATASSAAFAKLHRFRGSKR